MSVSLQRCAACSKGHPIAAVPWMIAHFARVYGLGRMDAYVVCSVAVDLKISEVVDQPNWIVSAYLPRDIMRPTGG